MVIFFRPIPLFSTAASCMGDVDSFIESVLANQPAGCQIPLTQIPELYDTLFARLKSQGLPDEEITDRFRRNLKGHCPKCKWLFVEHDLEHLWQASKEGLKSVPSYAVDITSQLTKGVCPNGQCSSKTMIIFWQPKY